MFSLLKDMHYQLWPATVLSEYTQTHTQFLTTAVLKSLFDQGFICTDLHVWIIDLKVSLSKAKLHISLYCSLFNVGIPCHAIVTPRYFVFVSSAWIWPWRVYMYLWIVFFLVILMTEHVRMELHQPVSLPPLQSMKVFLQLFLSFSAVKVRYKMVLIANSLTEECMVYSTISYLQISKLNASQYLSPTFHFLNTCTSMH